MHSRCGIRLHHGSKINFQITYKMMSKIRVNLNGIVKEMDTDKMEQMQTANGNWHYVVTDKNGCLTILTPKVR
jgi:hypothetical protein